MSAPRSRPTRRHFLRGVGGFALAIPFLPSLERAARAAAAPPIKRFVAFTTNHGGALGVDLHPNPAILTQSQALGFQTVRRGALMDALTTSAGTAQLSPILSAASTALTPALVKKMNVLRGLMVPFYPGHQRAGHLGNWAAGASNNAVPPFPHLPTIDQVMGYSSTFYPAPPRMRVMVTPDGNGSWTYQNPTARTGPIQHVAAWTSSLALFDQIYTSPTGTKRAPVISYVLDDYKRVRTSAKISSADRERLDAHIANVDELEKALNAPQACGSEPRPTMDSENLLLQVDVGVAYRLILDVIAVAFACDTSRIAVVPMAPYGNGSSFSHYKGGDYHADIAHQAGNTPQIKPTPPLTARQWQTAGYQRAFEQAFVYLANKLDAIPTGTGTTVLDASLLAWTHESGVYTHRGYDMPVILAGSAGGALTTGSHVDYRDLVTPGHPHPDKEGAETEYYGLSWHQYLGTVLQAMAIPPSDFTRGNTFGGYGQYQPATSLYGDVARIEASMAVANNFLPFLKP
jgi:hypothetical protein